MLHNVRLGSKSTCCGRLETAMSKSFTLKINPLANGRFARKADVAATSAVGGSILYVAIGDFPMVGPTHVNQPIGEFSLTPILKSPILHQ